MRNLGQAAAASSIVSSSSSSASAKHSGKASSLSAPTNPAIAN